MRDHFQVGADIWVLERMAEGGQGGLQLDTPQRVAGEQPCIVPGLLVIARMVRGTGVGQGPDVFWYYSSGKGRSHLTHFCLGDPHIKAWSFFNF